MSHQFVEWNLKISGGPLLSVDVTGCMRGRREGEGLKAVSVSWG